MDETVLEWQPNNTFNRFGSCHTKVSLAHCRLHCGKDDARSVGNGAVEVKNYVLEFRAHEVQIYNI